MRIILLLNCFLLLSCFDNGTMEQFTLNDGEYMSTDSLCIATLNLTNKTLIIVDKNINQTVDTLVVGNHFVVKGCPTNISYSCEMHCYKLVADSINILGSKISNPVIGPSGNIGMIICTEPEQKTSGGAGLYPDNNNTRFIEFMRQ